LQYYRKPHFTLFYLPALQHSFAPVFVSDILIIYPSGRTALLLELLLSDEFKAALDCCPEAIRNQAMDTIQRLRLDPWHPGLQAHRIRSTVDKWECYVNQDWRIIYDWGDNNVLRLWKLGDHRIIDRVHRRVFSPQTAFSRLEIDEPEEAEAETETAAGTEGNLAIEQMPEAEADNPFRYFPATHLRILGIPSHLVRKVQRTRRLEELEQIEGLPEQSLHWMLDLATDCELEHVIYNPDNLLFRTTLDRLRGYCQGSLKRLMLNLDPEQDRYVKSRHTGALVLRGCAGSGKTTVGIYRAIERAAAGRKVLLLTYTRTLNGVNKTLIEELIGPLPENLEVNTFFNWLVKYLRQAHGIEFNIAEAPRQKEILKEALRQAKQTSDTAIPALGMDFYLTEIQQVIKGNGIDSLEHYLQVRRFGRNTPLPPQYRRAVWAVYTAYQQLLREAGLCDWSDLPLVGLQKITENPLDDPYDDVILDEGQDLTPVQLRLTRELIKGGDPRSHRSYMVMADASQTIYNRGFSWKDAGIEARGRTSILRKNFRNTRQVAAAATRLLEHNSLLTQEREFIEPSWSHRIGARPRLVICDLEEREVRFVCEEILDLAGGGHFRLSDFAVLCPTNDICRQYCDEFTRRGIPNLFHRDEAFNILEEKVKVMTIHSSKGIEFPVVFVTAVRRGLLPRYFNRPGLDPEEAQLDFERFRTLLYVAMTRAAENLFLLTTAGKESPYLNEIAGLVDREEYRGKDSRCT
jgi:superfamily I DNA/RNA helicase/mRNA-degrading endonuclease YafQ of YafQ-DinJ toxin-antitoxin module